MVKIRLSRRGRKKLALYSILVADGRSPRDGRFVEKLGTYNPNTTPATVVLNEEKALYWVLNGAQPTDTVRVILSRRGIMLRKHLQLGVNKGAITQDQANARLAEWEKTRQTRFETKMGKLTQGKDDAKKVRHAAEVKVNLARAESQKKAQTPPSTEKVEKTETAE